MKENRIKWADALEVAAEIEEELKDSCHKTIIAGSIRRRKEFVNDVEILCIPKINKVEVDDFFKKEKVSLLNLKIEELIKRKILKKRLKIDGTCTYGEKIKLLIHTKTNIPVDIFITTEENWYNNLVARTGGLKTNIAIATKAKYRGMRWLLAGSGLQNFKTKEIIKINSEKELFDKLDIPYILPANRM